MFNPAESLSEASDRLCAEAVRLHKTISAMPPNYSDRADLTRELVGVRTAVCLIHGGAPDPAVPSSHPASTIVPDWWRRTHPEDWAGDDAIRTRHAEQLFLAMHQLLVASKHTSPNTFSQVAGISRATAYFVFGDPARPNWRTLEGPVKALGGHRDELWELWRKAHKRPPKTTPPPRIGRGLGRQART